MSSRPLHPGQARFEGGLTEVGPGVHAWLQPSGLLGESNAGLVIGDGASLLVDTLWDPRLTRRMLAAMAPLIAKAPIETLVNSHSDGDHWWGNQELARAEIVATDAAAAVKAEQSPAEMKRFGLLAGALRLAGSLPLPYPRRPRPGAAPRRRAIPRPRPRFARHLSRVVVGALIPELRRLGARDVAARRFNAGLTHIRAVVPRDAIPSLETRPDIARVVQLVRRIGRVKRRDLALILTTDGGRKYELRGRLRAAARVDPLGVSRLGAAEFVLVTLASTTGGGCGRPSREAAGVIST